MLFAVFALLVTGIAAVLIFLPTAHIFNYLRTGMPGVEDYKMRPTRLVKAAANPQPWERGANYNQKELSAEALQKLENYHTNAFLVIQNGRLKYEKYCNGFDARTRSNSFSMVKTMMAMLTGIALQEGRIKSIDEPVGDFLPYFRTGGKEKITFRHLLTMSSGLKFEESDKSYFALLSRMYFSSDLESVVQDFSVQEEPGEIWWYRSGDTAVLGLALEEAFGRTLAEVMAEKIYSRLGSEQDALWTTDFSGKHELAFCCFNATAHDFARIGALMLNGGKWNGEQIVPADFIREMETPAPLKFRTNDDKFARYGFYTHLFNERGMQIISANGYLGQYVFVVPEKNAIIVRLGASDSGKQPKINYFPEENFVILDAGLELLD